MHGGGGEPHQDQTAKEQQELQLHPQRASLSQRRPGPVPGESLTVLFSRRSRAASSSRSMSIYLGAWTSTGRSTNDRWRCVARFFQPQSRREHRAEIQDLNFSVAPWLCG